MGVIYIERSESLDVDVVYMNMGSLLTSFSAVRQSKRLRLFNVGSRIWINDLLHGEGVALKF